LSEPVLADDLPGVSIVWLDGSALDAVERLHRRSIVGIDAGLVKPERRSFFESVFGGRGEVVGAVVRGSDGETGLPEGRLAAYGVLLTTLAEGEDAGERIGLGGNAGLAKIAGTGVDPLDRGRGLQRTLIRHRVARAATRGFSHVFATAAPANTLSWRNLMQEGFAVADVVLAYGRLERFLLFRSTAAVRAPVDAPDRWVAGDQTDDVRSAVAAGFLGSAWRERQPTAGTRVFEIGFRPGAGARA
jgi:ribosomal protein S18 acetylase RimI-like enzyme